MLRWTRPLLPGSLDTQQASLGSFEGWREQKKKAAAAHAALMQEHSEARERKLREQQVRRARGMS